MLRSQSSREKSIKKNTFETKYNNWKKMKLGEDELN